MFLLKVLRSPFVKKLVLAVLLEAVAGFAAKKRRRKGEEGALGYSSERPFAVPEMQACPALSYQPKEPVGRRGSEIPLPPQEKFPSPQGPFGGSPPPSREARVTPTNLPLCLGLPSIA